jgi:hypothetical protein
MRSRLGDPIWIKQFNLCLETCRTRSPWQLFKNTTVRSLAIILTFVRVMCTFNPRQLVMDRIQSYPLSIGNGPMKSMMSATNPRLDLGRNSSSFTIVVGAN